MHFGENRSLFIFILDNGSKYSRFGFQIFKVLISCQRMQPSKTGIPCKMIIMFWTQAIFFLSGILFISHCSLFFTVCPEYLSLSSRCNILHLTRHTCGLLFPDSLYSWQREWIPLTMSGYLYWISKHPHHKAALWELHFNLVPTKTSPNRTSTCIFKIQII